MKCPMCQRGETRFMLFGLPVCHACFNVWLDYKRPPIADEVAMAELNDLIRQVEKGEK